MEAALAAVEENRRVPACRSGKQWRVLKMLSGRRHRGAVQCPLVCPAHSCYRRPERNPSRVQPSGRAQGPLKSALPLMALAAPRAGARRVWWSAYWVQWESWKARIDAQTYCPKTGHWLLDVVTWLCLLVPPGWSQGTSRWSPTYYILLCSSRWLGSSKAEENDGHRRHRPAAAAVNAAPCGASAS